MERNHRSGDPVEAQLVALARPTRLANCWKRTASR